ncbi:MAG: hypothetical protein MSC31_02790 [Solirubrobacteraceae bacterium MAG38_C4-C5]|nr:hypothetical protein [Candidatus Siliceabacter maunaloa]
MRFVDLLKTTVLLSMAAAMALAGLTVAASTDERQALPVLMGWWLGAGLVGGVIGRRRVTTPPIARLLAGARAATTLPQLRPLPVFLGRLCPIFVGTAVAGGLAFLGPQVPGIAVGFTIIWSLSWRHQDAAVAAIEDRDGVAFFVESASPLKPMTLVRTPSFRAEVPGAVPDRAG